MNVQTVKLIPFVGGNPPSPWRVVHNGKSGDTPATYPKVELPSGAPQMIVFTIGGNPNSPIKFANSNPMSVKPWSKPDPGSTDPQIFAVRSDDGKQLFVLDTNDTAGELHYTLDMVGHDDLDPIIDNGGRPFTVGITEMLIAGAVLLAIGFSVRHFLVR